MPNLGSFRYVGTNVNLWPFSTTAYIDIESSNAPRFAVSDKQVYTSYSDTSRWHAFPIRCLSTTSTIKMFTLMLGSGRGSQSHGDLGRVMGWPSCH